MGFFSAKRTSSSKKSEAKAPLKNVIDGSILTRAGVIDQLPYVFFLALIALIYIGNRFQAERIVRESIKIQAELKELRAESITTASRLMHMSKQSEVAKLVDRHNLGLKEAVEPPRKLIVTEND